MPRLRNKGPGEKTSCIVEHSFFHHNYAVLLSSHKNSHRQCTNEPAWLCSNKTLCWEEDSESPVCMMTRVCSSPVVPDDLHCAEATRVPAAPLLSPSIHLHGGAPCLANRRKTLGMKPSALFPQGHPVKVILLSQALTLSLVSVSDSLWDWRRGGRTGPVGHFPSVLSKAPFAITVTCAIPAHESDICIFCKMIT